MSRNNCVTYSQNDRQTDKPTNGMSDPRYLWSPTFSERGRQKSKQINIPFFEWIVKLEYPMSSTIPFKSTVAAISASSPFSWSVDARNDPFMDIALLSGNSQFDDVPLSNLTSFLDFKTLLGEDF